MKFRPLLLGVLLGLIVGCSGPSVYYAAPPLEVSERVPSRYGSVEVLQVSLPAYAASDDLLVLAEDGSLQTNGLFWADDPTRSVTLSLSRALTQITGAQVSSAPWPFDTLPEARVDVRVERFLADASGRLVLSGQYFVAGFDERGRNTARLFDLSRALPGEPALDDLLNARSALVAELAIMIAREGLAG